MPRNSFMVGVATPRNTPSSVTAKGPGAAQALMMGPVISKQTVAISRCKNDCQFRFGDFREDMDGRSPLSAELAAAIISRIGSGRVLSGNYLYCLVGDPFSFLLSKKGRGFTATFAKDAKLNQSNRNICARDLLDMMQVKWIFPSVRVVLRDSPAAVVLRAFAPVARDSFSFLLSKKGRGGYRNVR